MRQSAGSVEIRVCPGLQQLLHLCHITSGRSSRELCPRAYRDSGLLKFFCQEIIGPVQAAVQFCGVQAGLITGMQVNSGIAKELKKFLLNSVFAMTVCGFDKQHQRIIPLGIHCIHIRPLAQQFTHGRIIIAVGAKTLEHGLVKRRI